MKSLPQGSWKPALALMLLAPFLAEVISGATSLFGFFSPIIFLSYVVLLYGIPILVIREVAVRRRFGLLALWLVGLVYALYNEGLFAQTLFYPLDSPLEMHTSYGLIGDVRIPLAVFISFWHALISVVLPILLIQYLFPAKAAQPWLSKRVTWIFGIACAGLAIMGFFSGIGRDDERVGDLSRTATLFGLILLVSFIIFFTANKLSGVLRIIEIERSKFSWKPVAYGALLFALINVIPYGLADSKVWWPFFVLYFLILGTAGIIIAMGCTSVTLDKAVAFGVGAGLAAAVVLATAGGILPAALFGGFFITVLLHVKRHSKKDASGTEPDMT